MGELNFLDVMALAIIAVSVITALVKGLTVELFSLASVVLGFYLAVYFYATAAALLSSAGLSTVLANFFAFTGIFVATVVVGSVAIFLIDKAIRKLHLKWTDRLLGGVFGLVRGWLIAAVIFLAFTAFPVRKELLARSQFAEFFLTSARLIMALAPDEFAELFDSGYQKLYRFWIEQTQ